MPTRTLLGKHLTSLPDLRRSIWNISRKSASLFFVSVQTGWEQSFKCKQWKMNDFRQQKKEGGSQLGGTTLNSVCVCCRHFATSQLVNYANWSLGTCFGARMKYCLHTLSHDWLHMLGENTQKIRPVEGKMSEQSTSSRRKARSFPARDKKCWQLKQKVTIWSHFTWINTVGNDAGVEEVGVAAPDSVNIVSAFIWMCQQCQCSFVETRLGWWKKTAYVEDV